MQREAVRESLPPRASSATSARHRRRLRPLWQRLLWLAIVAMVPLAVIAGAGVARLLAQQRDQAERASLDFTRAFANAIEGDLQRSIAVLSVVAAAPLLDASDAAAQRDLLRRVLATLPDWRALILSDAAGRVVAHTGFPAGQEPPLAERESFQRAVDERRPVVGHLARGPGGQWAAPIRYPVLRDGQLKYVLSGIVKPEAILAVVQRQRVPDDWIVSVFDARQARIARSRGHEASVGTGPAPSLRELLASTAAEGMGVTSTLEGDRVYTAYVRLRDSGWIVAAGLPTAAFEADLRKAVVVYGGAIALSLLLAALFALLFARRINQPIAELREAARALGRGTVPAAPRTDIVEVHDVGRALEQAARELARSEGERETLLEAERHARTRLESLALDNSRLYSQAVAAGAQAEAANRAKDQFLAMLGHELRNPLAPIVTAIELMKRRHAGVAERERGIIERQVNHLSRLVDDLLDVSRIAQGKVQLDLRRIDLRHVVEQALEIAAPALGERAPIDVETPDAPVWIDGDEVRLVQVVCNLLANAVKFTSARGAIGVRVTAEGNDAVVVVRDEGIGHHAGVAAACVRAVRAGGAGARSARRRARAGAGHRQDAGRVARRQRRCRERRRRPRQPVHRAVAARGGRAGRRCRAGA